MLDELEGQSLEVRRDRSSLASLSEDFISNFALTNNILNISEENFVLCSGSCPRSGAWGGGSKTFFQMMVRRHIKLTGMTRRT